MITQLFATKKSMGQAWTNSGKRLVVTRLSAANNCVVTEISPEKNGYRAFQIGFGKKKLKNMTKPLQTQMNKSGFSFGVRQIREVKVDNDAAISLKAGDLIAVPDVLSIGDIVDVQGVSKGKGFAGVIKRHGFHGGQRTHGQSDRERAPGAIGQRTTPGRVFKGKKMAGHMGDENVTVRSLQVIKIDDQTGEVWLNGPVPGHFNSIVRLTIREHKDFEGLKQIKASEKQIEVENKTIEIADSVEIETEKVDKKVAKETEVKKEEKASE